GEVPILTSSSAGSNVTYKNFGTVVTFLPIVLGDGRIHLEVQPEVSTVDNALGLSVGGISPASAPGFDTRSARVAVMMEDGATLAIGGLVQTKINGTTNKVPCLGDLPFIGVCFRSVSYNEQEEELLILVTPRLVDPMACTQLPKLLPGQETRSPDDFELFLEGILEAPRGQRSVSLFGYEPAWKNSPSAEHIPCGNGNGSGGCGSGGCNNGPTQGYITQPATTNEPSRQLPESMPPRLVRPVNTRDMDDPLEGVGITLPIGAESR
ncbi:MAG TPA: hypothetical protein VKE98_21390, partial [Gemmataceae bacterium]|nr:hypothetical protein [Gemmataceae bacterium]